jgi:uncharacterized protein
MPINFPSSFPFKLPPILRLTVRSGAIGGLGLAGAIWILDGVTDALGDWIPAIVVGSGLAWGYLKLQAQAGSVAPLSHRPITVDTVKTAVADAAGMVNQLAQEVADQTIAGATNPATGQQLAKLRLQIHELLSGLDRQEIRFAVMGGQAVGKTCLKDLLEADWLGVLAAPGQSHQLLIEDTPALFRALPDGMAAEQQAWQLAKTADVVLFVTDGDLTQTQLQVIQRLTAAHRRTLVVFNKQDQYLPKEQVDVLAKIRDRLTGLIPAVDVIAVSTQPRPLKVRQLQADGSAQEWLEEPTRQITPLLDRLNHILLQEGQKLIWASSLGNAEALKAEAKVKLNSLRRERALPLIDRAQWLVAGTAFANPFPALDMLATAAINAQLVIDLGKLYQQEITIAQAKVIATTLAGLMLKLGVVEVATQAIGGILKTNAITYAAGGLAQGVSGAYLTRLAGFTLAEYFEAEPQSSRFKPDKLQQILASVFERNQRGQFLTMFVKQMVDRLIAEIPSLSTTTPVEPEATIADLPIAQAEPWHVSADLKAIRVESQPSEVMAEEMMSR